VIWRGLSLMPRTVRLLMGAVPDDVELQEIMDELEAIDGVESIHHLHVWNLGEHRRALEVHIVPSSSSLERFEILKLAIRKRVSSRFGIEHATLEACLARNCEMDLIAVTGQDPNCEANNKDGG